MVNGNSRKGSLMTIDAMMSSASLTLQDVNPTTAVSSSQSTDGTACTHHAHGDRSHLSERSQFFSKLDSLATSDPEKFKSVTAEIADKLQAAAKNASGDEAQRLNDLANKFTTASQTGTTDAIRPSESQHSHRHKPYEGDAAQNAAAGPNPSGDQNASTWQDIFTLVQEA
jgi:hypothetical protein